MDDWTTSPQFWISSAVSAITGFLLQYLYGLGHSKIQPLLAGAKGQLRSFFRGRKLKDLRRVKAARFDSVRINREIALSYVMLTLFIAMAALCVISFAFMPPDARSSPILGFLYASMTGIPLLIFEFAWLVTSTRVNEMLKYRSRIKRRGRRIC
ncbi:hypothetical protein [Pseudomonas amygdali]|uniref:hypothetical protein n=1 Tax=Pseudomonas amygdali TaxID=47877 RepID=UPI001C584B0F|nr:hypothetical protein [Pseudomonas amygdali]QXW46882.1 hypothetical protein KXJ79_10140 [Pseudomonas amygdali]